MNLPNFLTILRIIAAPIIAILIWQETSIFQLIIAFFLFVIAGATDWLDGYLARAMGIESHLGRILDPIADKVLLACILLALASHYTRDWLFILPALTIFLREFVISGFREYMSKEGIIIQVSMLAKWKTTLQLVAVGLILLSMIFVENKMIYYSSITIFWLSAVVTITTAFDYLKTGLSALK
ncbi:CDP-diacylglycerol--glycerol-3-phosphate 3-phosphatidyltransferase [Alphaproteobacteria bacterium]|nr:CDP-diacylglycerol--glycerol-3-phosphate 3-phosphatidyltransferase [Alphaproteobacteria bacterium]MBT5798578.1 CDP-diacylglycerol--glycerol-3-phosphate 3-phosphatidyltransferase [Alphaproteobacteria bacterium]MDA9190643.1 CDP-diacylglycerol--glycerol-3-phosphate 3-phosphatidyltransferase [Alphaproteobacteria bacterium]